MSEYRPFESLYTHGFVRVAVCTPRGVVILGCRQLASTGSGDNPIRGYTFTIRTDVRVLGVSTSRFGFRVRRTLL
jgi:hypothetical protein